MTKDLKQEIEALAILDMEQNDFLVELPYTKFSICDAVERELPIN